MKRWRRVVQADVADRWGTRIVRPTPRHDAACSVYARPGLTNSGHWTRGLGDVVARRPKAAGPRGSDMRRRLRHDHADPAGGLAAGGEARLPDEQRTVVDRDRDRLLHSRLGRRAAVARDDMGDPVPATVVMIPAVSTLRTSELFQSAMYRFPDVIDREAVRAGVDRCVGRRPAIARVADRSVAHHGRDGPGRVDLPDAEVAAIPQVDASVRTDRDSRPRRTGNSRRSRRWPDRRHPRSRSHRCPRRRGSRPTDRSSGTGSCRRSTACRRAPPRGWPAPIWASIAGPPSPVDPSPRPCRRWS